MAFAAMDDTITIVIFFDQINENNEHSNTS